VGRERRRVDNQDQSCESCKMEKRRKRKLETQLMERTHGEKKDFQVEGSRGRKKDRGEKERG